MDIDIVNQVTVVYSTVSMGNLTNINFAWRRAPYTEYGVFGALTSKGGYSILCEIGVFSGR